MKNIFCVILTLITLNSCKVVNNSNDSVDGVYNSKGKDYEYQLVLQSDDTFTIKYKVLEVKSDCEGKWKIKDKDLIILTCNEPKSIEETLQGGYISNRVMELKIKNRRELLLNGVTLKKE